MKFVSSIGMFLGRVLLSLYFVWSGVTKLLTFHDQLLSFSAAGVPVPKLFATLFILIQILGGTSLFLGYRYKLGAFLIILSRIWGVIYFHDFWNLDDAAADMQKMYFLQNLALIGGLLYVISTGAGACAYDRKAKSHVTREEPSEPEVIEDVEVVEIQQSVVEIESADSELK
ncbi:MAG: DoxX family protein [Chlamydiota bacterium]|nr:DoxX family protein [Chlamydiota bacterium]